MFDYDAERLRGVMLEIAHSSISSEARSWLDDKIGSAEISTINAAFSLMPRQTGKHSIAIKSSDEESISQLKPGYEVGEWTAERLCRVCLLMNIDPADSDKYFKTIENLFLAAE